MIHFTMRAVSAFLSAAVCCTVIPLSNCWAELPAIVRVEEYWELEVATVDLNSEAPQISCAMSPVGDLNAAWVTFELNHRTLPTFSAGGMQLQLFNGDDVASHVDANENKLLKNAGESITWTQSMELVDGQLVFAVSDGQSTTWGPFANNGHLQRAVATTLTDLGDYDPNLSVQNSGVVLAANRVESLLMRKFRLILEDGQILEDDTVRIVAGDN